MNNPQIPVDSHNHSTQSPDGENSVREMIEQAIKLGIQRYTITDHLEINKFFDEEFLYEEPVRESSVIVPQLAAEYSDRISVYYGVELGQPLHDMELTTRMLRSYDYDFIIGSCHMVRGYEDFYYLDYNEIDPEFLLSIYFEECLEMAEWGGFDVLGHITYPLRYITGESGIHIDMTKYDKIIDEIFRTLIKNDMGIEINSSGLFDKLGTTLPDLRLVTRYKELGGKILTIGSDAHCTNDLGKGIPQAIEIAAKAGFTEIAYYEKRQPKFINIQTMPD